MQIWYKSGGIHVNGTDFNNEPVRPSERAILKKRVRFLALFAILLAIEAIFCFTPLGSIPIGPMVATLAMIPVCITAVMLGTGAGTAMGFFAGLFSFIYWTFLAPGPMSLAFTPFYKMEIGEITVGGSALTLLICFVPRILTGTVAGLIFKAFSDRSKKEAVHYIGAALAGIAGSVVNTVGVLGGIALFVGGDFGRALESLNAGGFVSYATVWGFIGATILTNSIAEAVVSGVVTPAAVPIRKLLNKKL